MDPQSEPIDHTITVDSEAVVAQEAFERHGNPPGPLTDALECAMDIAERAEDAGKTSTSFTLIANYAFSTCKLLLDCVPLDGSALPPSPTPADYRRASLFAGGLPVLSVILRQTSDLLDLGLSEEKRGVTEAALETITACIGELVFHLEQFKEIEGSESNVDRSEHDVSFPKGPSIPDVDAEEGFGVAMGSRSRIHDSGGAAPSVLESPPADREVSQFYYRPSSLGLSAGGDGGKNLILLNNEAQRLGLGVGWEDTQTVGPNNTTIWASTVIINGERLASGHGARKRHARDEAARLALIRLLERGDTQTPSQPLNYLSPIF